MKHCAAWLLFFAALALFGAQTMRAFGVVAFHADFFEKKGHRGGGRRPRRGGRRRHRRPRGAGKRHQPGHRPGIAAAVRAAPIQVVMVRGLGHRPRRPKPSHRGPAQAVRPGSSACAWWRRAAAASSSASTRTSSPKASTAGPRCSTPPTTPGARPWPRPSGPASQKPPAGEHPPEPRWGRASTSWSSARSPPCWWSAASSPIRKKRQALADPDYQKQMAQAIYNGLVRYLKETPQTKVWQTAE